MQLLLVIIVIVLAVTGVVLVHLTISRRITDLSVALRIELTSSTNITQIGKELTVYLEVEAGFSSHNATVEILLPSSFLVMDGETLWRGDFVYGQKVQLHVTVMARNAGSFVILGRAFVVRNEVIIGTQKSIVIEVLS